MSLVRIAARLAAVQALKGKTLVGDNVLDSQIGALDVAADGTLRTDADKPFISVYADAAKSEENVLRSWVENGATEFLFEAGVTAAHVETDPVTGVSTLIGIGIPGTDANFELLLDIVARQIGDALSDPTNDWAEIFRRLGRGIDKIERARTSGDGSGIRLAAQQIKATIWLVADPVSKAEMKDTHPLARFFAKAADVPELTDIVALMQAQLAGEEYQWQSDLRRYGMTRDEGDAMLITTPSGAEADIEIAIVDVAPATPGDGEDDE